MLVRKDVLERRVVDLRDILTRLRPMLARLVGDDVRIEVAPRQVADAAATTAS